MKAALIPPVRTRHLLMVPSLYSFDSSVVSAVIRSLRNPTQQIFRMSRPQQKPTAAVVSVGIRSNVSRTHALRDQASVYGEIQLSRDKGVRIRARSRLKLTLAVGLGVVWIIVPIYEPLGANALADESAKATRSQTAVQSPSMQTMLLSGPKLWDLSRMSFTSRAAVPPLLPAPQPREARS